MGAEPKVEIRSLGKEIRGARSRIKILEDVTFDVQKGKFLSVIGPSGCGKSTLLRILGGLEKASAGRVAFHDTVPGRPLANIVFQGDSLLPWLSVRENVAFGLRMQNKPKREIREAVEYNLDVMGLSSFGEAYPYQLSGGMRQRVALARAFANDPEILLMDEPFAALDEQTKLRVEEELLRLWEERQATILFVTHSLDEAIVLSDRVVILGGQPGRLVDELEVQLARPRSIVESRASATYAGLYSHLWRMLEPGATAGVGGVASTSD